jgi:hypothetical protein
MSELREPSEMSRAEREGRKSLPMKNQKNTKSSITRSRSKRIRIWVARDEYSNWKYSLSSEMKINWKLNVF